MTRPIQCARVHIRGVVLSLLALGAAGIWPAIAAAQAPPAPPRSATEPQGYVREPDIVTRLVIFADRHFGKGDLTNGLKLNTGHMVPGSGWLTIGPGYRHWYANDKVLFDASAGISTNNYRRVQARVDLPTLAHGRINLGTTVRWQDLRALHFFGEGPESSEDALTSYRLQSKQLAGYVTLRPLKWLALNAEAGWLRPSTESVPAGSNPAILGARTFVPAGVSLAMDTRDFPAHPMRGGLVRAAAVRYDDRNDGTFTFTQYEGEAAAFLPMAGGRVVVALHGLGVTVGDAPAVPFYLLPSLGGSTSLRSYRNYRFHDRNMLVTNAEIRIAMMTHADLVVFMDAGNVAARWRDLNVNKRSYGAGFRLHTRRQTFALVDVAHGDEGWRLVFRISDPLNLSRVLRRFVSVPFIP